jgi:hypothetical protein
MELDAVLVYGDKLGVVALVAHSIETVGLSDDSVWRNQFDRLFACELRSEPHEQTVIN